MAGVDPFTLQQEAKAEQGQVVLRVFCAACRKRDAVATVRRSSHGPLFEAVAVTPSMIEASTARLQRNRDQFGRRTPMTSEVIFNLLERSDLEQDAPRAYCPVHGWADIALPELATAVASSDKKLLIHEDAAAS